MAADLDVPNPMDPKLFEAIKRGDKPLFETLLGTNVDRDSHVVSIPNSQILPSATSTGNTALHIAARFGRAEMAEKICRMEKSLLVALNVMLETPLHVAAMEGDEKMVSLLVSFYRGDEKARVGMMLRWKNQFGETALNAAARFGHAEVMNLLMSEDNELAGVVDNEGLSPLFLATATGSLKAVRTITQRLQSEELDQSFYLGHDRKTALHAAVLESIEVARELMDWKHSLAKLVDNSKNTPLHYVASVGNHDMACLLLSYDTSIMYMLDQQGQLPIHVAAGMNNVNVVKELLKHQPDCDELRDAHGRTILHIAVKKVQLQMVKFITKQPNFARMLNMRDSKGNTPVHLAVKTRDNNIFNLLFQNKQARMSLMNNKGLTPLDLAKMQIEEGISYRQNPQNLILRVLTRSGARFSSRRWDQFNHERNVRKSREEKNDKSLKTAKTLITGAVLIATVTFAAGFTIPGGMVADDHDHEYKGTPILARRYGFKAFLLADSLAFICSIISTICLVTSGSPIVDYKIRIRYSRYGLATLRMATKSMVAAFGLAVYVMLAPVNPILAILICTVVFASLLFDTLRIFEMLRLEILLHTRIGCKGFCWDSAHPLTRKREPLGKSPLKSNIQWVLSFSAAFTFIILFAYL